jgi:hypothetical protein
MFLRNVGIYLQVHTALKPKIPTSTTADKMQFTTMLEQQEDAGNTPSEGIPV